MVVDDNEDAADLLTLLLEEEGYESFTAYDGSAAIAAARSSPPDVMILDIGMPGMSGYEVAQELRQDSRFEHTTLVALTGWGTPEDRRRALAAGFDFHLTKPVARDALSKALENASRGRANTSSPKAS